MRFPGQDWSVNLHRRTTTALPNSRPLNKKGGWYGTFERVPLDKSAFRNTRHRIPLHAFRRGVRGYKYMPH